MFDGFDLTYEGLKLIEMYQDAIRYGGFDLTYEGLKYGTQWVQAKWGEQF